MKSRSFDTTKAVFLATAMLGLATSFALAGAENVINKSFQVQPGGKLIVELDRGSIEVATAEFGTVNVEIARKAGGSQSQAEEILKDHVVTIGQNGDTVEVSGKYTGPKSSGWFGWFRRAPDLKVTCRVTVPRKFDVDLKTAGGSIGVAGLTGKSEAHTSGGSIKFEKMEGPILARTSGGSITIATCRGPVDVSTSGGSLRFSHIDGDLTGHTSGGSIHADDLVGRCVVKTSGGSIEVSDVKGQVEAGTSGGGVSVRLLEQPTGDCSFTTSGGSITVALPADVAVNIDASTSGGRVSTDFPVVSVVQGEQKKNEIQGKINGGGPLIVARTSGGSVHIEKQ